MKGRVSYRADVMRAWRQLDAAIERETFTAPDGSVWQRSRGNWYRAYDSDRPLTSLELAQAVWHDPQM